MMVRPHHYHQPYYVNGVNGVYVEGTLVFWEINQNVLPIEQG